MMKKTIILLMLTLTTNISAQNVEKKCKSCGKSFSQSRYKGKHPQNSPVKNNGTGVLTKKHSFSVNNDIYSIDGVSFKMIKVEGGTFQMGAHENQLATAKYDQKPIHSVTLSGFYIGETEVTQELWSTLMSKNPSENKGKNNPVESITYKEIQTFINKLNSISNLKFRLPTEAEWEYAARGGKESRGYKYSGSNKLSDVSLGGQKWPAYPVKSKAPNELGIYDMTGNVSECCSDKYDIYSSSSQTNPIGVSNDTYCIIRGGSFMDGGTSTGEDMASTSHRLRWLPTYRTNSVGFRLVLNL